jgi:hypothetical protein
MTESDWLSATDPEAMLRHLLARGAAERKLRLVGCASVRLLWDHLDDNRSKRAVEVAERFAGGRTGLHQLEQAVHCARAMARDRSLAASVGRAHVFGLARRLLREAVRDVVQPRVSRSVYAALRALRLGWAYFALREPWDENKYPAVQNGVEEAARHQADVFREVFGNPFCAARFDPAWRKWHDGTVLRLAEAVDADAAFDRLPVLADALEDAGCDRADLLAHLRGPGPHVRGCWALDLVLDRK